jgi:hypothetical protein
MFILQGARAFYTTLTLPPAFNILYISLDSHILYFSHLCSGKQIFIETRGVRLICDKGTVLDNDRTLNELGEFGYD